MRNKSSKVLPTNQTASAELIDNVRTDVNNYLADYFDTQITRALLHDKDYAEMWRSLKTVALAGGKRLRPYITALSYQAYSGLSYKKIIPICAAQELLHVMLLIHDDIIDEDYTRHGSDNMSGIYLKRYQPLIGDSKYRMHYANSAAMLGGDLLLSAAYLCINRSGLEPSKISLANEILSEAIFIVCAGEFSDTESAFKKTSQEDAIKIAMQKTASYSFVSPLIMGATLAGASKDSLENLREFGTDLGIAFQLADDILGMFGNELVTGKSAYSDLRQGKRTYLMLKALELSKHKKRELESYLNKPDITIQDVESARQIITASGALKETENLIESYAASSTEILESLKLDTNYQKLFKNLITSATNRSH
jgi:geranylgeranyl diphosphate synthase type II